MNRNAALAFVLMVSFVVFFSKIYALWAFVPQSTHQWRQTDSAGMMLVYTQNGLNFFSPGIMNSMNGDYHTVAEFPIFYYIAAICCNLFFYSEGWLRSIHLLVLLAGFYYLYRWMLGLGLSVSLALVLLLVLLSSPVLLYYGFNLLPDPAGLGLSLIALSLIGMHQLKGLTNGQKFLLGISLALAGMIKIPFMAVPLGYYAILYVGRMERMSELKHFIFAALGSALVWLAVAKGYNYLHHSDYFLSRLMPIWNCDWVDCKNIFLRIKNGWFFDYFSQQAWLLVGVSFAGLFLTYRLLDLHLRRLLVWSFVVFVAIFLAWFIQFEHHDYYFILVYPFFSLLIVLGVLALHRKYPNRSLPITVVLLVAGLSQLNHAKSVIWSRYDLQSPFQVDCLPTVYHHRAEIQQWLGDNQVGPDAQVLNISDGMTNGSLYFLQRHGWNQFNFKAHKQKLDSQSLEYFKNLGAKQLIFHESRWKDTSWIKAKIDLTGLSSFRDSIFLVKL